MISGASRTYDELEVGAVYRSRFGRTVLEADNMWRDGDSPSPEIMRFVRAGAGPGDPKP
jgi:hypothetical protein